MSILTLQTSAFGVYGGIPAYNRQVCRALNCFDDVIEKRVLIATDKPADVERHAQELRNLRLESFAGNRAAFARRALKLAASRRIDLVLVGHVNYAPLGWMIRRLQPESRYGVMVHGVEVWGKLSRLRRLALQRADFVVSVSDYTGRQAIDVNGVAAQRICLLANSLECRDDASALPVALMPAGTRLLSVCRLDAAEKYKGVDAVIESLPALAARVPDVQYIVVGDGSDKARLQKLARQTGVASRVHFLGRVDDAALQAYYRACDVFVMPSGGEGFGIVFLEAMMCEKAVVAADSGGSPEVVVDKVTGRLVRYGDTAQLAEVLSELCLDSEQRARLGRAGRRRLQQHFTFPQFKRSLTDILMREMPPSCLYRNRRRMVEEKIEAVSAV